MSNATGRLLANRMFKNASTIGSTKQRIALIGKYKEFYNATIRYQAGNGLYCG